MYLKTRQIKIRLRKMAVNARKLVRLVFILLFIYFLVGLIVGTYKVTFKIERVEKPLLNPLAEPTPISKVNNEIVKIVEAVEPPPERVIKGTASYYSRVGCLGCNKNMIMANGKSLDDNALTLAMTPEMVKKYKLLNDTVTVINAKTGKSVKAVVTDTGGFARHKRVADLTIATRDAINCKNLCEVIIKF